jgi:hypothetical protein
MRDMPYCASNRPKSVGSVVRDSRYGSSQDKSSDGVKWKKTPDLCNSSMAPTLRDHAVTMAQRAESHSGREIQRNSSYLRYLSIGKTGGPAYRSYRLLFLMLRCAGLSREHLSIQRLGAF